MPSFRTRSYAQIWLGPRLEDRGNNPLATAFGSRIQEGAAPAAPQARCSGASRFQKGGDKFEVALSRGMLHLQSCTMRFMRVQKRSVDSINTLVVAGALAISATQSFARS